MADRLGDLVIFLSLVGVIAAVGIRVGMLLAPRIGRMAESDDDDPAAATPAGTNAPADTNGEERRDDD